MSGYLSDTDPKLGLEWVWRRRVSSNERIALALEAAVVEQMTIVDWTPKPAGPQTAVHSHMRWAGPSQAEKDRAKLKAEILEEVAAAVRKADQQL